MFKCKKFNYAVFGNPINHSQSPKIHNFFSKNIGIPYVYHAVNVELSDFFSTMIKFFKECGDGANITAPFKKEAYLFANKLTYRAKIARSVNTLKKIDNSHILGDNTDGIGLLYDLIRLKFIKKTYSVLVLGAGGVVSGIIFQLLSFGCSVFIFNRTFENAEKLVLQFCKYGKIKNFTINYKKKIHFDLIINARSKCVQLENYFIPAHIFSPRTYFYDINYHVNGTTSFIDWCIKNKIRFFSHGIGMLVFQAAHSCLLWHKIFPETNSIISDFNKNMLIYRKI
ncbi:MAG: shikimate dehydrogenase [Buchnera aphidicola (Pentalonia nigronervosa)]|uniref:shikimate dehydrogenase (NADP(+)) n=1 Tax=Buchnera aphidicola (Pentalonia nigronervosa) TaxID=1309793 RepID=A0A7H1AYW6_9GAMM|nr:MAG: shikimate dehydrogenase [Buchnera aphidicola (Pentalonia nigronervosa)]